MPAPRRGSPSSGRRPRPCACSATRRARGKVAIAAGVPVIPATEVLPDDMAEVRRMAEAVGYPFMLKASWGGGGRGMRPIMGPDELEDKVLEGRREAVAAFGNGEGYLEKMILERPARRGADPRRQVRHDLSPLGARLLGAAAEPEGGGAGAGAVPEPGAAGACLRAGAEDRAGGELRVRRDGRVPDGPRFGRVLLHRGQPARPGRAYGDRGGHRHRHRAGADPGRRGQDAGRGDREGEPGRDQAQRARDPVPDHHRGSAEQLHPRLWPDHRLSRARPGTGSGWTAAPPIPGR